MSGPKPAGHAALARALACLSATAILAACANTATSPSTPMTASQEVKTYIARAKPSYAPPGPPEDPWRPYIDEAAKKYDVPERWIREVMRVESGAHQFAPSGVLTTSPVGAMGLMQLMPETYDEVRARYGLGDDAYDPHNNILAGTAYLREMYDAFGSPGMLAAYNGGPARLEDYLVHNRPLPDETRRYVAMIAPYIEGTWPQARSPAEQYAVNQLPMDIPAGPRYPVHRVLAAYHTRAHHLREVVRYASVARIIQTGRHTRGVVEVAEAPEPRHASVHYASATLPAPRHGFHLIESAMASEVVRPVTSGHAVHGATSRAHETAHAAPAVMRSGHATIVRASATSSVHASAHACHKAHGRCSA